MDLHYSTTRDVWVEPASGAIVAVEEQPRRWLARSVDDPNAVTTLEAHTHFDDETINGLAQQAKDARTAILWGTRYGPLSVPWSASCWWGPQSSSRAAGHE